MSIDNESGRRWARAFLIAGIAASIAGNVTDTVMAASAVPVALRIVGAAVWPVFLFGAIEVLVRILWPRTFLAWFGRTFLLSVSIPAAVTSFVHLHDLMIKMGDTGIARVAGPLAIDGLMIGCTIGLLVTRPVAPVPSRDVIPSLLLPQERRDVPDAEMEEVRERFEEAFRSGKMEILDPISPAGPTAPRTRRTQWDVAGVARMVMEGEKDGPIMDQHGISPATIGRVRQAVGAIRSNPQADIPMTWKLNAEKVGIIRTEVMR